MWPIFVSSNSNKKINFLSPCGITLCLVYPVLLGVPTSPNAVSEAKKGIPQAGLWVSYSQGEEYRPEVTKRLLWLDNFCGGYQLPMSSRCINVSGQVRGVSGPWDKKIHGYSNSWQVVVAEFFL